MRFLRSHQLAPPAPPRTPDPDSTMVESAPPRPLREQLLLGQIDLLVQDRAALMARVERAEALLAAAAEQNRDLHPLLDRLGVLAGDVLPGVVAENSVLATRLAQGDRDLGLLTTALIGDLEPRAFESDNNDE
jgi:hypothetical protein